ncbi:MAG: Do family serine endopeptidase [Planctomycetaceae bacterium]|nr:Do family serine endopeptidase [Planctomycetaceae bacterium]
MKIKSRWTLGAMIALSMAVVTASYWGGFAVAQNSADNGPAPLTDAELKDLGHANSLSKAFRTASSRVLPAVVTIRTEIEQQQVMNRGQQVPDALKNDPFFRRFFENMPDQQRQVPRPRRQGMGSGVIIDPAGIILTNNHVVQDGDKVVVKLHDGREFEATDVTADPKTDLAIVKIEGAGNLPYAHLGESKSMNIGDWVIAVGAPFRLQESVTAGIISGKSRVIGINDREEYLQTDAAINPGNSGGPLVNLAGKVIGINTAISSTSGGYQGIGFAIPVDLAKWVVEQLKEYGEVKRAYLGVIIRSVNSSIADQLGVDTVKGALVTELKPDGPAGKSGLKVGDVILEFDGEKISQPSDLQRVVERASIGSKKQMKIIRDGKPQTLAVTIEELPSDLTVADFHDDAKSGSSDFSDLGLSVKELNQQISQQLGLDFSQGALVTQVENGSVAALAGLEPGDVIVKVGRVDVDSVESLKQALKKFDADNGLVLTVKNKQGSRIVYLGQ